MKSKNRIVHISMSAAFLVIILICGCKTNSEHWNNSEINPEGVFAQLLRIDAQNQSEQFETLITQLVRVADSVGLENPYYWICYRETPNHYWLLTISDSLDNFAHPGTIEGFASAISQFANPFERDEISSLSEALKELPVTRNVTQQYSNWSTTNNVESRDFPKSRIVTYQINETDLLKFNDNMAKLSDFLSSNNVTFQVEGFIAYPRTLNVAWQVIFLPENSSFDKVHEHYEFSVGLNKEALEQLTAIQEKIKSNINSIKYFDGIRIDSLSYGTY